jgi:hypothetical protein
VTINSAGMRDREHALSKPAGTLRVAVLGDSYAEAFQVPVEKNFCSVLEAELNRSAATDGLHVEVLNFGVSGYGTAQQLATLRHRVWAFHPDVVLLAFYAGNDLFDNRRALSPNPSAAQAPYFVYGAGGLALDESYRKHPNLQPRRIQWQNFCASVLNRSSLLQLVNQAVQNSRRHARNRALEKGAKTRGIGEMEDLIYSAPVEKEMVEAWRVTEGLIRLMHAEVSRRGARFFIATLATRPQLDPDPARKAAFLERLKLETPFYPDLRIRDLAVREGIPVITLAPAMSRHAEEHREFLSGFVNSALGRGHWNEAGHRLAGRIIAAEMSARLFSAASAPTR